MKRLFLRLYYSLCLLALSLSAHGQQPLGDDFDDDLSLGRRAVEEEDDLAMLAEYSGFHITFTQIVEVIILIIACYFFGKIWRGCTYLILAAAAVFYYLTH